MTETKPKRRWFQFSLRTLFVLIALLSIPIAWAASIQLNWIRQRNEFKNEFDINDMDFSGFRPNAAQCPWSLKLFGETDQKYVLVPIKYVAEARRLFPEAVILATSVSGRSNRIRTIDVGKSN